MRTVAYLGPEKTNTHFAALKKFGRGSQYLHAPTVEDIFLLVERGRADFGVVPVENSLEGSVTRTLDRFVSWRNSPVRIYGEIEMPIQHSLILHQDVKLSDIRTVSSHPQALAQCRDWLEKRVPRIRLVEVTSTAEAVQQLATASKPKRAFQPFYEAQGLDPARCAAIARKELAAENGLKAIAIPQDRQNKTRFLVIGLTNPKKGKKNKTSLMFTLKDKPGALHDALVPFKRNRINLTKIESRPSKRRVWEYLFFIDCEGHESDPRVRRALEALRRSTSECRVLGSYPMGRRG